MPAGHGLGQIGGRNSSSPMQQHNSNHNMMDYEDEEMVMAREMATKGRSGLRKRPSDKLNDVWKVIKRKLGNGPRIYEGERMIHINNQELNNPFKFCDNYVSTSKYNIVTFLPKFLTGESTPSFPLSAYLKTNISFHSTTRTILKICQHFLLIYRLYSTSSRSFTN